MLLDSSINKIRTFLKRSAVIFGAVFVSLIGFVGAHAAGIQNTANSATYSLANGHFGGERWVTNSGADPRSSHVQITTVRIVAWNSVRDDCLAQLKITNKFGSTFTSSNNLNIRTNVNTTYLDFTFNNSNLYLDEIATMFVNSVAGGGNPCTVASNYTLNFWAGNDTYSYANGVDTTSNVTSTQDIYFVINGGYDDIHFSTTPASTCPFLNFKVENNFMTSTLASCTASGTCSVGIAMNSNMNSTSTYLFNTNYGGLGSLTYPYYISNPWTMVSGTVYDARAYLCDKNDAGTCLMGVGYNSHIIAYSDDWQFIVNGLNTCTSTYYSQSDIPAPAGVTTTDFTSILQQANKQCDSYNDFTISGGIAYGLCKILVTMFVPSQDILNKFIQLKSQVAAKPPFGYVTAYSSVVNNFASSTSSTTDIATSTFDVTPQVNAFLATTWYTYIYNGIGVVVVIAGLFYIWWRFKHFSLHG